MNPQIRDLKNAQTRNLMRGLLQRDKDDHHLIPTFNNFRESLSPKDADVAAQLILNSSLFAHLPLPDAFPAKPQTKVGSIRLSSQNIECELAFQCARIQKHSDKLKQAVVQIADLNEAIFSEDAIRITERLKSIIDNFGYSLLILNKLTFVDVRFGEATEIKELCREHLNAFGLAQRNAIALAAVDMMGDRFQYLKLRQNFLEFSSRRSTSELYRDLLRWQFRPIRYGAADLATQLQSHGYSSLIDALFFILTHSFNVSLFPAGLAGRIKRSLPQELQDIWVKRFHRDIDAQILIGTTEEPESADFEFYRRSIAWIEYRQVAQFRNAIDPYFQDGKAELLLINSEARSYLNTFFSKDPSLADIAQKPSECILNIRSFHAETAGVFSRTIALLYILRKSRVSAGSITPTQLLDLLDSTRNVAVLASIGELRSFFRETATNRLVKYLASAIVADCTGSNVDQHALRRALQELVRASFDGDLIKFADYLFERAPHVAAHLYGECTEPFLVQLYFIIPSPSMVLETRARLHDWYADRFDEPQLHERARSLRLDQKLQMVRGDIDDNRIYVDPLRFSQWQDEDLTEQLGAILQSEKIDLEEIDKLSDISDFITNRQPHVHLAVLVSVAYREFCTNKRYGVDSYIGRRIRHGTLPGTMVPQLNGIIDNEKYAGLRRRNPKLDGKLSTWLEQYTQRVELWAKEVFHIRNKQKPRGCISTDVLANNRLPILRFILRDIVAKYAEHKSVATISSLIFEHCWNLIEPDLIATRQYIDAARLDWGTVSREDLLRYTDDDDANLLKELCREINNSTNERFSTLNGWFRRPANLLPSADVQLLFDAVLSEVKDLFPDYKPEISKEGLNDIQIVGRSYQLLYDFLYVVIHNAAKHGNKNGHLTFGIQANRISPSLQALELTVASEIRQTQSIADVRHNIELAMSGSFEDAMVVEGGSGLRKLRSLQFDSNEIEKIEPFYDPDMVGFRCLMTLG